MSPEERNMLRCKECDWKIDQQHSTAAEREIWTDALAGHMASAHGGGTSASLDRADGECPFRSEDMRAAFMVGWLARGGS